MKKIILFLLMILFIFHIQSYGINQNLKLKKESTEIYKLSKEWESERNFKVPESVIYNSSLEKIYVSNINGKSGKKDGNGFISILNLKGKIEKLQWITELDAPKGMAINQNKLFVADIDHLVEIDIKKGLIIKKYSAPNASFLNDVAIDKKGNIYISDTGNDTIYKMSEGKVTVWLKGSDIKRPNGIYIEKEILYLGNCGDGCLKAISIKDKKIRILARIGRSIDGLVPDGEGNFIISDWKGRTALIYQSDFLIDLLDTTKVKINSADIEYIVKKKLLIIPTFFDNRVISYRLKRQK